MNIQTIIEMTGYLGSLLVIVSMLMTSVVKLRVINTIGSIIFASYALFIHSYPTAVMQLFLIGINAVNLYKLLSTKKMYQAIKLKKDDAGFIHFVQNHQEDIKQYFPDFSLNSLQGEKSVFYLLESNDSQAGFFAAKLLNEQTLEALADYTTPAYRDSSAGAFLYSFLGEQGFKTIRAKSENQAHQKYLKKMGFEKDFSATDCYLKIL